MGHITAEPLVSYPETFVDDCKRFIESRNPSRMTFGNRVFTEVAIPMHKAWTLHKLREYPMAIQECGKIAHSDWREACIHWMRAKLQVWKTSNG
jgi:hypothetical protein